MCSEIKNLHEQRNHIAIVNTKDNDKGDGLSLEVVLDNRLS